MRATADRMLASPAFTITRGEVDEMVGTLSKALDHLAETVTE